MKSIIHAMPIASDVAVLPAPLVVRQTAEWSRQIEWSHIESELFLALESGFR